MKRWLNETQSQVINAGVQGIARGGTVGAMASIVTGTAVALSAPAWVPLIGGTLVVSGATMATWSAVGAATGGVLKAANKYRQIKKRDKDFEREFGL